jgi:hypothetical protein
MIDSLHVTSAIVAALLVLGMYSRLCMFSAEEWMTGISLTGHYWFDEGDS